MFRKIKFSFYESDFAKIILCVLGGNFLCILVFSMVVLYNKNIYKNDTLTKIGSTLSDEIEFLISENEKILKYMSSYILKNNLNQNHVALLEFLKEFANIKLSISSTSYVSWADENGLIRATGKGALIPEKDAKSISDRSYFKKCKEEPGKLFLSNISTSLFTKKNVLPTALGVASEDGKFLGYLVFGFNPEWVEFPAACGATRIDPIDTPLLAAGRFICGEVIKYLKRFISNDEKFLIYINGGSIKLYSEDVQYEKINDFIDSQKRRWNKVNMNLIRNKSDIEIYIIKDDSDYTFIFFIFLILNIFLLIYIFRSYITLILNPEKKIISMVTHYKCENKNDFDITDEKNCKEVTKLGEAIKSCFQTTSERFEKMKGIIKQNESALIACQQREIYHKDIIKRIRPILMDLMNSEHSSNAEKINLKKMLNKENEHQVDFNKDISFDVNSIIKESLLCYLDDIEKSTITLFKRLSTKLPLIYKDDLGIRHLLLCIINFSVHNTLPNGSLKVSTALSETKTNICIYVEYTGCLDKEDFSSYNKKKDDPVDNFYSSPDKIIKKAHLIGCYCRYESKRSNQKSYVFKVEIPILGDKENSKESNVINFVKH